MTRQGQSMAVVLALALGCIVQEDPNFGRNSDGSGGTGTDGSEEGNTSTGESGSTSSSESGTTETTDSGSTDSEGTETGPAPMEHQMFVTSTIHTGMLGGRAGADAICMARAAAADVPLPGTWVALLSTPGAAAKDTIPITGPVYNMIGGELAADAADLWDGALADTFSFDENGEAVGVRGWTGTTASGDASADHCNGWSAQQGGFQGTLGNASTMTSAWVEDGTGGCAQSFHLYCVRVG